MKKTLTEIVYILDRSGSMSGLEADTIGGFNTMIKKQKDTEESAYISTVLFDDRSKVIHDRVPIEKVDEITSKEYFVRGTTALLDAVGGAIRHIVNIHKYARKEDRPNKTIFVIITDGMENASRYYNYEQVKRMIEKEKNKYGWEFIFIGRERAVNYMHDNIGTKLIYEGVSQAMCSAMEADSSMVMEESLSNNKWKKEIVFDYLKRKK